MVRSYLDFLFLVSPFLQQMSAVASQQHSPVATMAASARRARCLASCPPARTHLVLQQVSFRFRYLHHWLLATIVVLLFVSILTSRSLLFALQEWECDQAARVGSLFPDPVACLYRALQPPPRSDCRLKTLLETRSTHRQTCRLGTSQRRLSVRRQAQAAVSRRAHKRGSLVETTVSDSDGKVWFSCVFRSRCGFATRLALLALFSFSQRANWQCQSCFSPTRRKIDPLPDFRSV